MTRLEVKGKYDYNSGHKDDLSFSAGQMIVVTEEVDEEWYQGEYIDDEGRLRQGMFPRNFVQSVPPKIRSSATAHGQAPTSKQDSAQSSAPYSSPVRLRSRPPDPPTGVPVLSHPAPRSPTKVVPASPSESPSSPAQSTSRKLPMEEANVEKPSSFRDRIAAFNKTSDAPLAPRTMPKPTSFVRKPFIPPPPSKSSYFVPPKPTAPPKPQSSDQTSMNRETADPPRPVQLDSQSELDFGKDNFKERIMAIQKELHYANQVPPRGVVRTEMLPETDDVENISKSPKSGEPNEPEILNITEPAIIPETSETRTENFNENELEPVVTADQTDEEKEEDKAEEEDEEKKEEEEDDEEEVDPEVARRLAIRERMAKMSGGMGMHMGIGLPPSYPRGKMAAKPPFTATSPPRERADPIPVIPALPPIKPKDIERGVQKLKVDDAQDTHSSQYKDSASPGDEASGEGVPESSKQLKAEEEPGPVLSAVQPLSTAMEAENDTYSESENEVPSASGHPEENPSTDESDDENVLSSVFGNNGRVSEPRTAVTMHDQTQHSARPRIPSTYSSSAEGVPRSRPPPPAPPAPPIPAVDLVRSPILLEYSAAPPNPSHEEKSDPGISVDLDPSSELMTGPGSPSSPKPPSSRPPPPPPPQVMPPRTPSISAKAPPIPMVPRNFETINPSLDQFYPEPSELMSSPIEPPRPPAKPAEGPQAPYSPPSPTSPVIRTSLSERPTQEARNRSSLDTARREVPYIALKEENLQDGTQWWLEDNAPPNAFKHRNDLVYETEDSTSSRRGNHVTVTRQVYILFSDYSQTQVTAQYERDDPSLVNLSQRHVPPPPQPTKSELESRHEQIGHQVVALAQIRVGASIGNGSAVALVHDVFAKLENCLPSAGIRSHGALVFSNFGNSSTKQFDEIRQGDVVAFRNAIFQVHGGLRGKGTLEVGRPDHVAIVQDWNGSKRKLKVLEQRPDTKRVTPNGYRLGDLRSGEVHVFRPMPRSWVGW